MRLVEGRTIFLNEACRLSSMRRISHSVSRCYVGQSELVLVVLEVCAAGLLFEFLVESTTEIINAARTALGVLPTSGGDFATIPSGGEAIVYSACPSRAH